MERNKEVFIKNIGQIAQADWHKKHICVPSIVIAIALEAIDWGRNEAEIDPIELFARRKDFHATSSILQHIVTEHNDYLATWKGPSQKAPNWEGLMGEGHYIRAVQFLQDAECPYHSDKDYERVLVEIIEGNKLIVYDEWYIHISQQCEIL